MATNNEIKKALFVGKVANMYFDGMEASEIAMAIKESESSVRSVIRLIEQDKKAYKEIVDKYKTLESVKTKNK